eukprot:TRINITY_DN933_c0_g1_i16.p1 TRINITY_DN933_c0_g1~~TRINITY_DN933_c0_g1_i16.p1  ORF type:complete len:144 (+),score=30.77 TRINITY_DN933_c0_g1_i16:407-838(+)
MRYFFYTTWKQWYQRRVRGAERKYMGCNQTTQADLKDETRSRVRKTTRTNETVGLIVTTNTPTPPPSAVIEARPTTWDFKDKQSIQAHSLTENRHVESEQFLNQLKKRTEAILERTRQEMFDLSLLDVVMEDYERNERYRIYR